MGVLGQWWAKLKQRGPIPLLMDAAVSFAAGSPMPVATTRSALDSAWEVYRKREADDALKVLAHELRRGNLTVDDLAQHQETAAMVFMLIRASVEGAARLNLIVLAKALRGYAVRGETAAERYARLVEIVKFMSRQELIVLAALRDACQEQGATIDDVMSATTATERAVADRLVPSVIRSRGELRAVLSALSRTGFVAAVPTTGAMGSAITAFVTTPLAEEAVVMAPLREALADEVGEPFFTR